MNNELLDKQITVTFPQPEPAPQAASPATPPPPGRRKLRCDAFWNTLNDEQKQKLQEWLLEQNLGFRETHARAQKELGLTCSLSTIGRIYQYLLKTRAVDELREGASAIKALSQSSPNLADLRKTSLQLIGVRLLQKAMEHHDVKELCAMGKLLLQSQERDIQQERATLAREKYEFKAAKAAIKAAPQLASYDQEEERRDLARIEVIKRVLFGREVDFIEKVPAEEEVNSQPR
jgi:hypothetical protein